VCGFNKLEVERIAGSGTRLVRSQCLNVGFACHSVKIRSLGDAKNDNTRLIVAARETMAKGVTVVSVPKESSGRQ
jgi:hypothetical protein